jgi:hypothetical protein
MNSSLAQESANVSAYTAVNITLAYTIMTVMTAMSLQFDIRLTGLRNAAHLNGSEGVMRGSDPANVKRRTALLDNTKGTCVSVLAENIVHIRRGDYKGR